MDGLEKAIEAEVENAPSEAPEAEEAPTEE